MDRRFSMCAIFVFSAMYIPSDVYAQSIYFEAKVTSGTFSETIANSYSKYAKNKEGSGSHYWDIVGVADFNQDGIPDFLYRTYYSGPHGAQLFKMILEKGVLNGKCESWQEWTVSSIPPGVDAIIGDWDGDGDDDLAYSINGGEGVQCRLLSWEKNKFVTKDIQVSGWPYSAIDLLGAYPGDYNGDGSIDFYKCSYDNHSYLFLASEPFVFDCFTDLPYVPRYVVKTKFSFADMNRDGCVDVLAWRSGRLNLYFGDRDRERIFSATREYSAPIQATSLKAVSVSGVEAPAAYLQSATEFLWITSDPEGALTLKPMQLGEDFYPKNVAAGDVNRDAYADFLSWNENRLSLYFGEFQNSFQNISIIELPYVREIKGVFVRDADRDDKNDIVVVSEDGDIVTLYQRDAPPPTPTPTQTPFPPTPMQPTPTPASPSTNDLIVDPTESLEERIAEAPDGAAFYLEPGEHFSFAFSTYALIEKKNISLIGIESERSARIVKFLYFVDSILRLQNLSFDYLVNPTGFSYDDSFCYLIFNDVDLELINCFIRGPFEYSNYGAFSFRNADPSLQILDCVDKTIVLKDNEIEAGDSGVNILVENCQDTTLDLRENPMLGIDNRIAHVQIVDSTNVTVLLRNVDNPYYPRSLTTLTVFRSTVNVTGGVIRGYDGLPDVVGENGGYAIRANEGSTVTLQNVGVAGGRGGDGIEPGRNGPATLVDETSAVLWESAVNNWELH